MNITKGKWEAKLNRDESWVVMSGSIVIATFHRKDWPEWNEANARLLAEAGTVANETGFTPRQLADRAAGLEKENVKKDKQYKWLKGHYDRRGVHMQGYKDAIKPLIPEGEHYKLCSDYFAKTLLKRFSQLADQKAELLRACKDVRLELDFILQLAKQETNKHFKAIKIATVSKRIDQVEAAIKNATN